MFSSTIYLNLIANGLIVLINIFSSSLANAHKLNLLELMRNLWSWVINIIRKSSFHFVRSLEILIWFFFIVIRKSCFWCEKLCVLCLAIMIFIGMLYLDHWSPHLPHQNDTSCNTNNLRWASLQITSTSSGKIKSIVSGLHHLTLYTYNAIITYLWTTSTHSFSLSL